MPGVCSEWQCILLSPVPIYILPNQYSTRSNLMAVLILTYIFIVQRSSQKNIYSKKSFFKQRPKYTWITFDLNCYNLYTKWNLWATRLQWHYQQIEVVYQTTQNSCYSGTHPGHSFSKHKCNNSNSYCILCLHDVSKFHSKPTCFQKQIQVKTTILTIQVHVLAVTRTHYEMQYTEIPRCMVV